MNFLCSDVLKDIVLPIVIFVGGIAIAVAIYWGIKSKITNACNGKCINSNTSLEVDVKVPYITEVEMKFLEHLHRAMPKELIAFPRVGVDQIVKPKKDKVAFNTILNKYVDICVFTRKGLEPALVIDLVVSNASVKQYEEMDTNVVAVLKKIKVPVLRVKIEDGVDTETLRANILKALPDRVVSALKDNYISSNTK